MTTSLSHCAPKDSLNMPKSHLVRPRRMRQVSAGVLAFALTWLPKPANAQTANLDGSWNLGTITPLQRPAEFRGRATLSPEEASEYERARFERGRERGTEEFRQLQSDYNDIWNEPLTLDRRRTALIVDPPDGLLPPTLPGVRRAAEAPATPRYDNPEDADLMDRCLLATRGPASQASPPMIPNTVFSPYYQIVQTSDSVLIFAEHVHDARIVRLNGAHPPDAVRRWLGDSIGRWEGATLVVDTTNFRSDALFAGSGANRHVVERFTRTDQATIRYVVTVEDSTVWSKPWTAELTFNATTNQLFEFACHEGNRAIELYLRGARFTERGGGGPRQ